MMRILTGLAAAAFAAAGVAAPKSGTHVHEYPTSDRVQFVQTCMQDHPGPHYEMLSKCSCTLDTIARSVSFEDYTEMNTATLANSIGGERGNTIRDTPLLQKDIRRYRDLLAEAKKACFIEGPPVRR